VELALLVLRVVVGLLFVGHGAQKLFGVFGGHGIAGTAGFFESIGLRPGRIHAPAAGAAEFVGGALIALGLLTPLGAALIIAVMVAAVATVHLPNGIWATGNGYELNLVYGAVAFALAGVGAGEISIDNVIGWDVAGAGWALGALAVGLVGGIGAVLSGRQAAARAEATRPATPHTA
jgi:putative oxidoreductase